MKINQDLFKFGARMGTYDRKKFRTPPPVHPLQNSIPSLHTHDNFYDKNDIFQHRLIIIKLRYIYIVYIDCYLCKLNKFQKLINHREMNYSINLRYDIYKQNI